MLSLYSLLLASVLTTFTPKQQADLIVHHGKVYTIDSAFTVAEAFAVKDGKIIAVGKDADIDATYTATKVVDAHGLPIYPGFIDAHAHFVGYGRSLYEVNLYGCKDWDEVVQRVQSFAAAHPDEQWVRGRGWDQNKWPGKSFPDNSKLNQLFPDKPVLLQRVDGHAAIANAKALDMAGVRAGQAIVGGTVEVKDGKLTGMLVDNAVDLVVRVIPKASKQVYEKWLGKAQVNCFAAGLTTLTDCGLMYNDIDIIDSLQRRVSC